MAKLTKTKKEKTKSMQEKGDVNSTKEHVSVAPMKAKPKMKATPKVTPVVPIAEEKMPVIVVKKDNPFITTSTADKKITVRYSDAELLEFRSLIEGKIIQVDEDIKSLKSLLEGDGENKNFMEQASEETNRNTIRTTINQKIEYKEKLYSALNRIQHKTYGVCVKTGQLIDKARLKAVPHTTQTLEAKLALNTHR